jgi:hypothetical protein
MAVNKSDVLEEVKKQMMPIVKVEETKPNKVIAKLFLEGRGDVLIGILSRLFQANANKEMYLTLMLEEKPKSK